MTDPWTNEKIQADPRDYLKWQKEARTKAERERKEAEERDDFRRFSEMFQERGGVPAEAPAMYRRYRNDMALEAAKEHSQAARERTRIQRLRAV
jgi:hypothetical protein